MAAAVVAVGAAVVGAAASSATVAVLGTLGASIVGALVATAIGFAGSLLFPPQLPSFSAPQLNFDSSGGGRTQLVRQPITSWKTIYGECAVSGPMVFIHTEGDRNETLYIVVAIAGHEIESFEEIYLADQLVELDADGNATNEPWFDETDGAFVRMELFTGTPDQTASSILTSAVPEKWTPDHRLRGRAYAVIQLEYDEVIFPSGIPNPRFVVRGKNDILDPRTNQRRYTNNAALCILDYLSTPAQQAGYGASIDRFNLTNWAAEANICDENVRLAKEDPSDPNIFEPRYTCNGVIDTADSSTRIIEELLTSCAGALDFSGGQWNLQTASYRVPVFSLDEGYAIGPVTLRPRTSRRELFNRVKGTYISEKNAWQPADYPAVTDATFEQQDGEPLFVDLNLKFTTSSATAQRLGKIFLRRHRASEEVDYPVDLRALQIRVTDNVMVTHPDFGYTNKIMQVGRWELTSEGTISLTMKEENPEIYDWDPDVDEVFVPDAPDVIVPTDVDRTPPDAIGNLNAAIIGTADVELTWTNPTATDFFRTRVYRGTSPQFVNATQVVALLADPGTAQTYQDMALPTGTQYYWVVAEDVNRNLSDPSNRVNVTIS